jgi:membrane protease YdiL (CAAX protease family)
MNKNANNLLLYIFYVSIIIVSYKLLIINKFFINEPNNHIFLLIDFLLKTSLFLITIYWIKKNEICYKSFNKNKIIALIVSLILIYLSYNNVISKSIEYKVAISNDKLLLYSLKNLSIGFFEEFFFRILIFGLILKIFVNKNLFIITIITSLIFALVHFQNLFLTDFDFESALFQVILAFALGVFFQLLVINLKNIYLASFIHAIVDFNGMLKQKFFNIPVSIEKDTGFDYETLVIALSLMVIMIIIAYFNLKNKKISVLRSFIFQNSSAV